MVAIMDVNPLKKIGLIVLAVSFLFYLIAFGAPNWAKTDPNKTERREHIGLWQYCTYPIGGSQQCDDFINIIVGDWLKAAEAFMTLALFSFLPALGLVAMIAFVEDYSDNMKIVGAAIASVGATFLFLLIGVAVFGGECDQYFSTKEPGLWEDVTVLDWAFYIGLISCIGTATTLALILIEVVMGGDDY